MKKYANGKLTVGLNIFQFGEKNLVSVKEAAFLIGVSERSVYRLVDKEILTKTKVPGLQQVFFDFEEILTYLKTL